MPHHQKNRTEQYCNKFNKAFKNGPHQKILKRKKKVVEAMDQQINHPGEERMKETCRERELKEQTVL